jgi:YidC/Oxa1 family membrane protein insertase
MNFFFVVFYQPIFNFLVWLYNVIPGNDLGVAIIILTLVIRFILYPLSKKSIKSQKEMQTIQPEIEKIKEKYKGDQQKMGPEIMALYKEKKINPFSSCLPMLVQLPFLFAIYRVFFDGLTKDDSMGALYSFVANPGTLDVIAFGFFDLSERSWALALLAGAAQFWQLKMLAAKKKAGAKTGGAASAMTNNMLYFMPLFTVFIGSRFPAGLTLYWLLTTLFSVAQQYIVLNKKKKPGIEVIDKKVEVIDK